MADKYERFHAKAKNELECIFLGHDISGFSIQGDPRGFCLKITTKQGEEISPEWFN